MPQLEMVIPPAKQLRFRYATEAPGSHGFLRGKSSHKRGNSIHFDELEYKISEKITENSLTTNGNDTIKDFPTVKLLNYVGEAFIQCSLYQVESDDHKDPLPHYHKLFENNDRMENYHRIRVSCESGYVAQFKNLSVVQTSRKSIKIASLNEQASKVNINQVRLCFQAFEKIYPGCQDTSSVYSQMQREICDPIYSEPINNMS